MILQQSFFFRYLMLMCYKHFFFRHLINGLEDRILNFYITSCCMSIKIRSYIVQSISFISYRTDEKMSSRENSEWFSFKLACKRSHQNILQYVLMYVCKKKKNRNRSRNVLKFIYIIIQQFYGFLLLKCASGVKRIVLEMDQGDEKNLF